MMEIIKTYFQIQITIKLKIAFILGIIEDIMKKIHYIILLPLSGTFDYIKDSSFGLLCMHNK